MLSSLFSKTFRLRKGHHDDGKLKYEINAVLLLRILQRPWMTLLLTLTRYFPIGIYLQNSHCKGVTMIIASQITNPPIQLVFSLAPSSLILIIS